MNTKLKNEVIMILKNIINSEIKTYNETQYMDALAIYFAQELIYKISEDDECTIVKLLDEKLKDSSNIKYKVEALIYQNLDDELSRISLSESLYWGVKGL